MAGGGTLMMPRRLAVAAANPKTRTKTRSLLHGILRAGFVLRYAATFACGCPGARVYNFGMFRLRKRRC